MNKMDIKKPVKQIGKKLKTTRQGFNLWPQKSWNNTYRPR